MLLSVSATDAAALAQTNKTLIESYFSQPISDSEFMQAKNHLLNETNKKDVAEMWLDADTYKLDSVKTDLQALQNITAADVNKLIERLKKEPSVTVLMIQNTPMATPNN